LDYINIVNHFCLYYKNNEGYRGKTLENAGECVRISVYKRYIYNNLPPEERNVAYLPQQYALFPHMTILENVAFGPIARGVTEEEALNQAHKALDMVKLDNRANALPRELSGGMQQRVALARALASKAKLLLLDEPSEGLAPLIVLQMRAGTRTERWFRPDLFCKGV
jgi:ABC-type Fe3+/spermidine/putrescine transport system ATPase subunit